jgi:phage repressor protein C with HTH and peptisase S24 domain
MLGDHGRSAERINDPGRVQEGLSRISHSQQLRFLRSHGNARCVTQDAKLWTMDTIAKRLKWARERRFGLKSVASEVARDHGWTVSTYLGHENGDRNPSRDKAKQYARAYGVRWEWILDGEGPPTARGPATRRIMGQIGAGADVIAPDHELGEETEAPTPPQNAVAVVVRGNSMFPRYFQGEKLFYVPEPHNADDLIGRECVVKLADGRILVKILRRGTRKRRYNLESWNAPLMEDQEIEWVAPVWRP